jgi:CRISPR/Cas system-associated protein Cas5 (RAMP superfamily)
MQPILMVGSKEDVVDADTVKADKEEGAVETAVFVLAAVVVSGHLETRAKPVVRIQTITPLLNGTNYLLKIATRFARSVMKGEQGRTK